MSVIFGVYRREHPAELRSHLEQMSSAFKKHGSREGSCIDGPVAIGQRLLPFTPADYFENQPLHDGHLVLVADARIDNRSELAQAFNLRSSETTEMPDSAFILQAYKKWEAECGLHLVGEFAFVIWDKQQQRLLAVRSPLGGRLLFYYHSGSTLAFSTLPQGLLSLPFVPRALNESKVASYLVSAGREPESTFFQGVKRLLPGHSLTFDAKGLNIRRYWEPNLKCEIRFKNDDDYVEAFLELYDRVTQDYLRSSSPVGILLSGGLDSSSLGATAALIQKQKGQTLTSFTEVPSSGFDGPMPKGYYANETPLVRAIAERHSNIQPHFVETSDLGLLQDCETFFEHSMMPARNVSNHVWWEAILRRAQEKGIRVLLSGEQGNLTISWEGGGLIEELVRSRRWGRALFEARAAVRRGKARSVGHILVGQGLLPLLPANAINWVSNIRSSQKDSTNGLSYSPINPHFANAQNINATLKDTQRRRSYQDRVQKKLARFEAIVAPDIGGVFTAAYRAMYGVEVRQPLGDLRLVEFCLSLPEEQQRRDGEARWLIRRAMADRLPSQILENQRRGVQAADWFERLAQERASHLGDLNLAEKSQLANQMLDIPRLRQIVGEWPQVGETTFQKTGPKRSLIEMGLMMGRYLPWLEKEVFN